MVSYNLLGTYDNKISTFLALTGNVSPVMQQPTVQHTVEPGDVFEKLLIKECEKNSRKIGAQPATQTGYNQYNFQRAGNTLALMRDLESRQNALNKIDDEPMVPGSQEKAAESNSQPQNTTQISQPSLREPIKTAPDNEEPPFNPSAAHEEMLRQMQQVEHSQREIDEEENHIIGVNEQL